MATFVIYNQKQKFSIVKESIVFIELNEERLDKEGSFKENHDKESLLIYLIDNHRLKIYTGHIDDNSTLNKEEMLIDIKKLYENLNFFLNSSNKESATFDVKDLLIERHKLK